MKKRILSYVWAVLAVLSLTMITTSVTSNAANKKMVKSIRYKSDIRFAYSLIIKGSVSFWDEKKIVYRPFSPELKASSVPAWKRQQPFSLAATKFIEHIVISQYIGRNENDHAGKAASQLLLFSILISVLVLIGNEGMLRLICLEK